MVQIEETTYEQLITASQQRAQQADEILLLKAEVAWYREQLGLAKKRLFAPSSEATPPGQETLLYFNAAESLAAPQAPEPPLEVVAAPQKKRKQTGQREMQLARLPIEEVLYTLP